ncbi:helix-turn-helix domain-containing protein [Butyricicoccus intestinisimiae]|uniref:Helix-turn-helix domain-containing protein n=1 Tax=Butyricicoccus intestinisimiae TaxID=2841509 RepID=A0ABS6ESK1_9FIRM|nr:helix-turn-helix domain-containing protein [Butyricicoccus intestinisimiae]MBU5489805.1 helix-turn-helix domain-containing protein [Butyricicoccus intestinisimiae]
MSIPKLRTINGAYAALKELDPSTAVSASAIRRLVKSGQLPAIYSGNRVYINMDVLTDFLERPENYPKPEQKPETVQGIRRVAL